MKWLLLKLLIQIKYFNMEDVDFKNNIRGIDGKFTESQLKLIDAFDKWYADKDDLVFTIAGEAGTGKTYMVNHIIRHCVKGRAVVTAPTHQAVRVISQMTHTIGKTIHSLHGLRPNYNLDNFDINNVQFHSLGEVKFGSYNIIFIDECGQIGEKLHSFNMQRAKIYHTKIVYIGDPLQLSPINEVHSKTFSIKNVFNLIEVVRQDKDNPLFNVLDLLREDVKKGSSKFLNYIYKNKTAINDRGEGYLTVNRNDFSILTTEYFKSSNFSKDLQYARYTAYTNSNIVKWNRYIRNIILDNPTEIIDSNDVFTSYQTIVDSYYKPIIINSEDYIIDSFDSRVSDDGFKCFNIAFKSTYSNYPSNVSIVDHTHSTFKYYYNIISSLHYKAIYARPSYKGRAWKDYYTFKTNHISMLDFNITDRDTGRIRAFVKKDIDYGYGLTIHKL